MRDKRCFIVALCVFLGSFVGTLVFLAIRRYCEEMNEYEADPYDDDYYDDLNEAFNEDLEFEEE